MKISLACQALALPPFLNGRDLDGWTRANRPGGFKAGDGHIKSAPEIPAMSAGEI